MPKVPPKNPLDQELIGGLYIPEFLPREIDLKRFVLDPVEDAQELASSLDAKVQAAERSEDFTPLTPAEAELADKRIDALVDEIRATRARISDTRDGIGVQVSPKGGNELSFKMDISKKPSLRRAITAVFGIKTDTITYSMYIRCLELKRQIEAEEAGDYTAGDWEG